MIFILQSGSTPAYLKEVLVILVLKKPSLAIDDMSNFHPAEGRCVHVLRLVCGWQPREPWPGAFHPQKGLVKSHRRGGEIDNSPTTAERMLFAAFLIDRAASYLPPKPLHPALQGCVCVCVLAEKPVA